MSANPEEDKNGPKRAKDNPNSTFVILNSPFGPFENFDDVVDKDSKGVRCILQSDNSTNMTCDSETEYVDSGPFLITSLFGPFPLLSDINPVQHEDMECQLDVGGTAANKANNQAVQYEHSDMREVCENNRVFGPFRQEINEVEGESPRTKEDEIRHLISGKQLFGPFENHPNEIMMKPRSEQIKDLITIYEEMFPKCPKLYLKQNAEDTVDDTEKQTKFIAALSETGVPPTAWLTTLKPEDIEMESESAWVRQYELHQYVSGTYPGISPDFLMDKVKKLSEPQIYNLIMDTFFNPKLMKEWPSRLHYDMKKRDEQLVEQYMSAFNPEEIKMAGFDPVKHYSNMERNVSKQYKKGARSFLMREFRAVPRPVIKEALEKANFGFYVAFNNLRQYKGKLRKTLRPIGHLPDDIEINLLKEVQFAKNAHIYIQFEKSQIAVRKDKVKEARALGLIRTCQSCFTDDCLPEEIITCPKNHQFCTECIRQASEVAIGESTAAIKCFEGSCETYFTLHNLQKVVEPRLFSLWLRKIQLSEAEKAIKKGLASCPFCAYVAIYDQPPSENRVFVCHNPDCRKESCRLCNELSHLPLRCDEVEKSAQVRMRTYIEMKMTESLLRHCNKCKKPFFKLEGCNKMTCQCGNSQCYLCGKDVRHYEHFYSDQHNKAEGKCPLHSDNKKLMEDEVKKGALLGKEAAEKQNEGIKLFVDPTKDVLKEKKEDKPAA